MKAMETKPKCTKMSVSAHTLDVMLFIARIHEQFSLHKTTWNRGASTVFGTRKPEFLFQLCHFLDVG